ncbi:hypothetical protein D3C78_1658040 [compost metagenome]
MFRDELDALNGIYDRLGQQNQLLNDLGAMLNELRIERKKESDISATNSSSRRKTNSEKA